MKIPQVIALAAMVAAGVTHAGPVTMKVTGYAMGGANVDTSLTGVIGGGELKAQMTMDGVTDNAFLTYCTDIFQSFRWNATYTDYSLVANGSAYGFTFGQADLLGKLYTQVGTVHSRDESVAFQLAVWEIVDETTSALDVLHGSFTIDSGASATQLNLANNWLAAASAKGATSNWTARRLYSPTAQDFVLFSTRVGSNAKLDALPGDLPEPSSLLLAAGALAGLGVAGRTRRC